MHFRRLVPIGLKNPHNTGFPARQKQPHFVPPMKKSLLILIAAAALASRANAATYFGTATYYSATMDVGSSLQNFTVAKFNIPEATITSITVKVTQSTLVGSITVTNSSIVEASITGLDSRFISRGVTSGLGYNQTTVWIQGVVTTPEWQTVTLEQGVPQVMSISPGQIFNVADQTIASQYWNAYTGSGDVTFAANNSSFVETTGEVVTTNASNAKTTTQFAVVYTYSIPEPSSALMVGLASLLCFHRRRAS